MVDQTHDHLYYDLQSHPCGISCTSITAFPPYMTYDRTKVLRREQTALLPLSHLSAPTPRPTKCLRITNGVAYSTALRAQTGPSSRHDPGGVTGLSQTSVLHFPPRAKLLENHRRRLQTHGRTYTALATIRGRSTSVAWDHRIPTDRTGPHATWPSTGDTSFSTLRRISSWKVCVPKGLKPCPY